MLNFDFNDARKKSEQSEKEICSYMPIVSPSFSVAFLKNFLRKPSRPHIPENLFLLETIWIWRQNLIRLKISQTNIDFGSVILNNFSAPWQNLIKKFILNSFSFLFSPDLNLQNHCWKVPEKPYRYWSQTLQMSF